MPQTPDDKFMQQARNLARRGQGRVEPNPMVGCVIVRHGKVIGRGFHQRFGQPHAEIEALRDCEKRGADPRGSDVYVTLEPCCHYGKTPPCTEALIAARPKRVVAAMVDPFPQVAGRGLAALREAGIEVTVGVGQEQARQLNAPFIKRVTTGLPWVIAKWAQTLDGRIANGAGQSKWISNDQSRRLVHAIRGRVDAIMVGVGTVLADNPLLTARDVPMLRVARRVVIDPRLRVPEDCRLLRSLNDGGPPLLLAVAPETLAARSAKLRRLEKQGVELFALPRASTGSARRLKPLLKHLAANRAATNVLVEGGARLFGTLFTQNLVDQALVFIAPRLMNDPDGLPPILDSTGRQLATANLSLSSLHRIDADVLLDYRCR